MPQSPALPLIPPDRIYLIRGQRVMLDADLARLYGVETRVLNQAVKRNASRFPVDFSFQLTHDEVATSLISQSVTSKRGGRRSLPYAFTEHGAVMAASVLNSERAVQASIYVVRAFVALRQALISHQDLADKLHELEQRYDAQFEEVFRALDALLSPPGTPREPVGFRKS